MVRPVELTIDHVRASAAIPIVFPRCAIRSAGTEVYFGDGGLRQVTPLSPAIRLGAERVFAIGVRSASAAGAALAAPSSARSRSTTFVAFRRRRSRRSAASS